MKYMIVRDVSIYREEAIQSVIKKVNKLLEHRGARILGGVSVAVDADGNWLVCQAVMVDE